MKRLKDILLCFALFVSALPLAALDYADAAMWVYCESAPATPEQGADVFFLAPTVCMSMANNMDVESSAERALFRRAVEEEHDIYALKARVFAPYYRQKSFLHYVNPEGQAVAYGDARDAFLYFLEHYSKGRPFVLAGYSQGSEHALRLIKEEVLADEKLAKRMVAAYLIGWCVSERDTNAAPQLRPAKGETDTGVFISWNSEAAGVKASMLVPRGVKAYTINPLNWRTDAVPAPAKLNLGGFARGIGREHTPQPQFCGVAVNPERGTLNPVFAQESRTPRTSPVFGQGVYHAHEPFFYYENLRQNVAKRISAFKKRKK